MHSCKLLNWLTSLFNMALREPGHISLDERLYQDNWSGEVGGRRALDPGEEGVRGGLTLYP